MKYLIKVLVFTAQLSLAAQSSTQFLNTLDQVDMAFEMPDGFEEAPITQNETMDYEYAIKHKVDNVEIRYAVRPILLREYENEDEKNHYEEMAEVENSNYMYFMLTTMLNITGGKEYGINEFGYSSKKRFNADWVASSSILIDSDFSTEYQFCQMVVIHKKNKATCYYFYLSDNPGTMAKLIPDTYGSLSFAN